MRLLLIVAHLALGLSACATTGATGPRATLTRFDAPGPGAANYDTTAPPGESLRGAMAARLRPRIEAGGAASGLSLRPDPRLAEVASWVAEHVAKHGQTPPAAAIDLVSHHLGMPEPGPHVVVLGGGDEQTLGDKLEHDIRGASGQLRYTHYGAASLERDEGPLVVVLLSWRWLTLSPVPRAVATGARVDLRATLEPNLKSPQLAVTGPDGVVTRSPPASTGALTMTLPTSVVGEHRVEILATGERGATVVANFPFYVGVPPVTHVEVEDEAAEGPLDADAVNARLLALINEERQRAGLAPVALDPRLSEIARRHGVDMRDNGFIGHRSPTTGEVADRVRAAGIRTALTMENVGRGYSAAGVHRGLLDSPGHRDNLLHPKVTHVGIGTIVTHDEDGQPTYLVTQVFIRINPTLDMDDAPDQLLEAIGRARRAAGLRELEEDEALSSLCAASAARYFAAPNEPREALVSELNRQATGRASAYGGLAAILTTADDVESVAGLRQLLDPKAGHVAVGVAQGTRPGGVPNSLAVVILLAYPR